MSRFLAITSDLAPGGDIGLALISGSALMQRHSPACCPGFWTIRQFEQTNHRTAPPVRAVIDDFGNLHEVFQ